ncbi:C40 family peptidase, partial [Salmonella enterica subsp. enterica serovar Kentucky]|nr:C40 family peptidase [Salmonella enterica subsp. enterica serovar Kentucky]
GCFWMPLRVAVLQKHILSGTQISFGIPSGIPEISTIRAYTYTSPRSGQEIKITSLNEEYWQRHYVGARRVMTPKTIR